MCYLCLTNVQYIKLGLSYFTLFTLIISRLNLLIIQLQGKNIILGITYIFVIF